MGGLSLPSEEFRPRITKGEEHRNHALGQQQRTLEEDFEADKRLVDRAHVPQFIGQAASHGRHLLVREFVERRLSFQDLVVGREALLPSINVR